MFSWGSLFAKLLDLFGPLLADLLKDLFARARPAGSPNGLDSPTAVREAFAAARGQTWRLFDSRRRKLNAAERVALRHAHDIVAAARDGARLPQLTQADRAELQAAA